MQTTTQNEFLNTYSVADPERAALVFSTLLAADKGVPNDVYKHARGFAVIDDTGKGILYIQGRG